MKKIIAALVVSLAFASSAFAADKYIPCDVDSQVFKAQTENGKKFVSICQYRNAYVYQFVKANGEVEKRIVQNDHDTQFEDEHGRMDGVSTIDFNEGKTRYSVGYLLSDGESSYHIWVYSGKKEIADIKLSDKNVINNISEYASNAL